MLLFAVAADIIAEPLARLYNLINQSGIVPDSFKTAKVKMLHKKKSKDNMGNYRPLSMTNHQGKIWERLINHAIIKHLEDNNLLSDRQHGFRPKRGAPFQISHNYGNTSYN
jgi:hypothetical protein